MLAVTEKLAWYVARSSGIIAWAVVTASILWGLTLSSRLVRRRGIPAWLLDLHRYLGTLSIVFTVIHMLALVADNWVYFGWRELFIPMATDWHPGATAWGIAAFYLMLAIQITSWMMRRLPRRIWHAIHLLSFPLFIGATIHGFQAGADRSNRLMQWAAFVGVTMVITIVIFRLLTFKPRRKRPSQGSASRTAAPRAAASVDSHSDGMATTSR
ncbi:MAG: ferric reductase-like transmembrane domain-containing protein [Actinomycetota bacterium]|jgi:DMSO/TMAO reductase YedYZ heme-binding membrane subunit|nr:MAG: ferric reductase transmembrane protein domain-containing protein [Acidimicrobiaceae bacterium]